MLAADKLQLQSALKQQATALKEKEFNLHHSNLMTVGTQAAVLAGLDITMFIEFNPPHNDDWGEDLKLFPRILKFIYYFTIVSAFCANMIVVSHTTVLSVLGAGLALRGPDGSMMTATDGLYDERKSVFQVFGVGMACTVASVVTGVWIILAWESALLCFLLALYTCRTIWLNYQRVQARFDYDESKTVDFRDIMEGPAAIQAVPWQQQYHPSSSSSNGYSSSISKGYKKASSYPMELLEKDPYDRYDLEWQSSQQQLLVSHKNNNDSVTKRRGRNSREASPSSLSDKDKAYIQTI